MGDMPEELQDQDPPFRKVGVDEGRVKVWVVVFVFSITSGVKLYLCRDYSEEGFLQAWRQHTSDWGEPHLSTVIEEAS